MPTVWNIAQIAFRVGRLFRSILISLSTYGMAQENAMEKVDWDSSDKIVHTPKQEPNEKKTI